MIERVTGHLHLRIIALDERNVNPAIVDYDYRGMMEQLATHIYFYPYELNIPTIEIFLGKIDRAILRNDLVGWVDETTGLPLAEDLVSTEFNRHTPKTQDCCWEAGNERSRPTVGFGL